jgi:hypothetical protein
MAWEYGAAHPKDFPTRRNVESNEKTAISECAEETYAECTGGTCEVCKRVFMYRLPTPGLERSIHALSQHYASDATDSSSSCDRSGNLPSWAKLHRTLCDQPIIKRQISRGRRRSSKGIPAVGSTRLLFARWNAYYVSAPSFHPKYSAAHSLPSVPEGSLAPSL